MLVASLTVWVLRCLCSVWFVVGAVENVIFVLVWTPMFADSREIVGGGMALSMSDTLGMWYEFPYHISLGSPRTVSDRIRTT
ncbi:hypothetical protein BV22DRAFT_818278 [Leucogyrophana mollusca]|uniref:Uncharacterized protein n=1 Tax=Leucogyrophana mollusca TaxID=85980 RepID=A0ACB8B5T5_9AGAM|nr:hypothetical protein BV22DRAFT_818278 [Leucogyrophana mollusca]